MKPISVINRGEQFVTLRATTDRPAEIREALAARDVQHVFKGDQNQAWDAIIANHCLARALGDSGTEITFFIQDERLGTPDTRLVRNWKKQGRRYVVTEDYYRGRAGAIWVHQDVSYGLLFTEAVSPEQFAAAGIHLHRAAELWQEHATACRQDERWVRAMAALGVIFPGSGDSADRASHLGPAANPDDLATFFADYSTAWLYYALTKTDGLYGVVPVQDANTTLSSIPLQDEELLACARRLLLLAARGAMRLAGSSTQRRGIKARVRGIAAWATGFLTDHPAASVADLQVAFGEWLTGQIFPADHLELDRASRFNHLTPEELPRLRTPEETLHFFLDLSLRFPQEFSEAYNEALNRVGFGLQRIKYDPKSGRYTPPFFVELAPGGPGTPVYRYGLELSGTAGTTIKLLNPSAGDLTVETDRRIRTAHDLVRSLFEELRPGDGLSIVGKAAAFAAEMQRTPRGLGLPRQGSKYAPMVDHLVSGLRARGVLRQSTGLLIRIGLNALDRLDALGELPLRLPRFLSDETGSSVTCRQLSRGWRETARHAHELLDLLSRTEVGQHVHLLRLAALNATGQDPTTCMAGDPRLAKIVRHLCDSPESGALLRQLGRDLPAAAVECIEHLSAERAQLLSRRRELTAAVASGELPKTSIDADAMEALETARQETECRQLLLWAAYVRRLWQRAESLGYVNDRPYTLALYLLFGRDIFPPICREVEFDVEYVSTGFHDGAFPDSLPQPEPIAR